MTKQPPSLDDPGHLRSERVKRYTYSATRRIVQRLFGVLAVIVAALGIDVSYWQSSVAWATVSGKQAKFVFIRALYGLTVDSKFVTHWINSKVEGVKRGAYLYYLDNLDPKAQAKKLYDTLLATGDLGELPPVLDIEGINNATLTASKIKLCAEEITKLFGKKCIIYTGFYVWRDEVTGDKTWAIAYKLWIAGYPFSGWKDTYYQLVLNYPPMIPAPWSVFYAWQWTANAPAPEYGVSGSDLDLDYASPEFANDYLGDTPPIDPPPVPTGELQMQFIAKTTVNIRPAPATTAKDIGNLPTNAVITALAMKLYAGGSFWVKFAPLPEWLTEPAPEYWACLEINAGSPLIDFHAAVPCPGENEMYVTLEEMTAAIAEALTSLVTNPPTTHKVFTTAPNGVKLRAYPGGSEAAMLANNTQVRLLIDKTWNEHKLYAAFIGNVWVSGWMKSEEVVSL